MNVGVSCLVLGFAAAVVQGEICEFNLSMFVIDSIAIAPDYEIKKYYYYVLG